MAQQKSLSPTDERKREFKVRLGGTALISSRLIRATLGVCELVCVEQDSWCFPQSVLRCPVMQHEQSFVGAFTCLRGSVCKPSGFISYFCKSITVRLSGCSAWKPTQGEVFILACTGEPKQNHNKTKRGGEEFFFFFFKAHKSKQKTTRA